MINPNDLAVDDEDMDPIHWELSNRSWFQLLDEDSELGEPDNIAHITQKLSLQELFHAETTLHLLTEENTRSMRVMGEEQLEADTQFYESLAESEWQDGFLQVPKRVRTEVDTKICL